MSTNKGKLPENDPLDNKDIRGTIVQPDLSLVDNTMMKKQKFVNKLIAFTSRCKCRQRNLLTMKVMEGMTTR